MAYSELESPDSYSSFLEMIAIHLSCLVLQILACDRQTDKQEWIITTAGPNIVVGQLIIYITFKQNRTTKYVLQKKKTTDV